MWSRPLASIAISFQWRTQLRVESCCLGRTRSVRWRGDTSENLVALLERRLDAVVYRAKFAPTPFAARQFVNHGHIQVNGRRVTIPSFQVKDGDTIQIKQKSRELAVVLESMASGEREAPDYIQVDQNQCKATFVRTPALADVPYATQMEPHLVVEYYSR